MKNTNGIEKKVNYMDIMRHIIPLICLLTIHFDETSFVEMFDIINKDRYISNVLIEQIKSWWGNTIDKKIIDILIDIYMRCVKNDKEINQIIRNVKELFIKSKDDPSKLSVLIDKYLIPQELEKKKNAEISTPHKLRQEMLDKIPKEFWTIPHKVFEPCSGKGGFLVDIIDRFMKGLSKAIQNKKERYRVIVEECLYWCDINPTNIYIGKLLIDPNNEYKLNFNEGDTLKLDINDKWKINGFDAIIGNPPYQSFGKTGDNKLYLSFIKKSISMIHENKYLLFIVPINVKNYITNQNKNRSYFNRFLKIEYLSLNVANRYFSKIGMYFSYFLLRNTKVEYCKVNVSYLRKGKIENNIITIHQYDNLPLCLSETDMNILNKTSNLIRHQYGTFDIKKASYVKNGRLVHQRIRSQHIKKGDIHTKRNNEYKYKIIDKITKTTKYPGIYYYNNIKMEDYGKSKIILCTGGYLMPSFDSEGIYNLSDNMLYMLCDDEIQYNGLCVLIESDLVKYLNKVTMTDGLHGRGVVIRNIKNVDLCKIKDNKSIYEEYNLTETEIQMIKDTI